MEFEVGDVVNSYSYGDADSDDFRVIQVIKNPWGPQKYVIECLRKGTRQEKSEYQLSLSRNDPKRMNELCDCGAKKIRHAAHVQWCSSLQDPTKELRNL